MSYDQGAESSAAFRTYLQHFELSLVDVAVAARVRLLTVWKIEQGLPIRAEHARPCEVVCSISLGCPIRRSSPSFLPRFCS